MRSFKQFAAKKLTKEQIRKLNGGEWSDAVCDVYYDFNGGIYGDLGEEAHDAIAAAIAEHCS